jgi:hypothetical protein
MVATPALGLTLAATASAPLLDWVTRGQRRAESFVDGLVQVMVAGLLLLHVLPAALLLAGWLGLLALGAGAAAGVVAHRLPGGEGTLAGLASVGLLLHGLADGVALAAGDEIELLGLSVLLHTAPVALATWRIASRRGGLAVGLGMLALTATATVCGYAAAEPLLEGSSPAALALAQCGVVGALLHVVWHLSPASPREARWGGLLGALCVVALGALGE